jgi:ubiquinol-cytochrome c reductase cytochrome b subunit
MKSPTALSSIVAQTCTLIYFMFFLMMPFYTRWDKTKPVPERVTS